MSIETRSRKSGRTAQLTGLFGGVLLGDARVQAGAALLVALLPVLAGLHVLTVPASRPLPFALRGVLAPARTEVLVLRVTSARVGIGSAA